MVAVASLPKEIAAGLHPKQNNAIRGLLLQSGWVVEKLEDNSCAVTYVVQVINIFIVPKCSLHSSILKKKKRFFSTKTNRTRWSLLTFTHMWLFVFFFQLDPAGWLPKCFVNRFNTKLVMIIENLRKLAQACPSEGENWLLLWSWEEWGGGV